MPQQRLEEGSAGDVFHKEERPTEEAARFLQQQRFRHRVAQSAQVAFDGKLGLCSWQPLRTGVNAQIERAAVSRRQVAGALETEAVCVRLPTIGYLHGRLKVAERSTAAARPQIPQETFA